MPNRRWLRFSTASFALFVVFPLVLLAEDTGSEVESSESEVSDSQTQPIPTAAIDEEIVVSASLVAVPRKQSGSSVTVISRSDLERRREASVAEVLRSVPGLEVVRTGGSGAASVFIRGANSSHTLVLIDGVRANSPMGGAYDWADLTSDQIERIEVLRGPQSALYGSEAIGGVVSIVSRRGEGELSASAGIEAGSRSSHRVWAGAGGGGDLWDWRVQASQQETDGYSSASEANGNVEKDPWENLSLAGSLGRTLIGEGSVVFSARFLDSATALDGFDFVAGPIDDLGYDQEREQLVTAVNADLPISDRWRQKIRIGYAEETLETENLDGSLSYLNSALDTTTQSIDLISDLVLSDEDSLSLGVSYEERDGESRDNFAESVDITSLFAENRLSWRDTLFLNVGLRYDDHSVYGDETTGKVAASWVLADPGTRFHGSWGTGFKAPTFVDLYFPFYGNPGLAPERSTSYDLGIEQTLGESDQWRLGLTLFASEIEDLIAFDFSTFLAGNIADAEVDGFEIEARWQPLSNLTARASYTQTDASDVATGDPLVRRPKHRYVVALNYSPFDRLDTELSYLGVRERYGVGGFEIDDYDRFDATVNYQLTSGLSVYLRARNLLDEEYEEVPGYTTPGAQISLGIQIGR